MRVLTQSRRGSSLALRWRSRAAAMLLVGVAALASAGSVFTGELSQRCAARAGAGEVPGAVHWFRDSAERTLSYSQSYRFAWLQLRQRLASAHVKTWAVVLDADETVLDNSPYEMRLAAQRMDYSDASWAGWIKERSAPVFPPAKQFIEQVQGAGGHVIIVTNRDESQCEDTRVDLQQHGVKAEGLLCASASDKGSKQRRFDAIIAGTALPALGPLPTLLYVGDSVGDCPYQTQAAYDPDVFGERCFVLPNPIYGSWMTNPYQ